METKQLESLLTGVLEDIRKYQAIEPMCTFDPSSEAHRLCRTACVLRDRIRCGS